MFEFNFYTAIDKIDSIMEYYEWESQQIESYLPSEIEKYSFAHDAHRYIMAKYNLQINPDNERNLSIVNKLEKAITKYIEVPEEQPLRQRQMVSFLEKSEINKLKEKGFATDVVNGEKKFRQLIDLE